MNTMTDTTNQSTKVAFAEDLDKNAAVKVIDSYKVQVDDILVKTEEAIIKLETSLGQAKTNKIVLLNQKKMLVDIETKINTALNIHAYEPASK